MVQCTIAEEAKMNSAKENLDLYKKAVEQGYANAVELGDLQLRSFKGLVEQQLELFGLMVDTQVKQAELLGQVKDYPEYLNEQARIGRELAEGLAVKSRAGVELAGNASAEYRAWMEKSLHAAGESWQKAAESQA
jgi:TPR repeat protein